MFHTELYSSSIATGANTFGQVTALFAGAVMAAQNNGFTVVNELAFISQIFGVGANLVHIRLQSNSMLPFPYPNLSPNNRGTAFESPVRSWDFAHSPIPLRPSEEIDIFATQNHGSNETEYIGVNFSDGIPTPLAFPLMPAITGGTAMVPGRAFTVHWTATTTLSAGAWTQVTPALDGPVALPAGTYGLIGMRAFSATCLFARMFPITGSKYRPGGIGVQAYDQMDPWWQRAWPWGGKILAPMGIWLMFYQNVLPRVEFFATSADTAEEGWLDLVFLSPQPMPGV
jgi:hypothetical protein